MRVGAAPRARRARRETSWALTPGVWVSGGVGPLSSARYQVACTPPSANTHSCYTHTHQHAARPLRAVHRQVAARVGGGVRALRRRLHAVEGQLHLRLAVGGQR